MNIKTFVKITILICICLSIYYLYIKHRSENSRDSNQLLSEQEVISRGSNSSTNVNVDYSLPAGDQVYNVSHGKEVTGPKMSQIVYSPLSFESGQTQKIKIVFPEKEVVGSVVLFINTDTKENQKVTLKKESKTNNWVGEWIADDTIKTRYSVKIVAVGSAGEYNNTMYFL